MRFIKDIWERVVKLMTLLGQMQSVRESHDKYENLHSFNFHIYQRKRNK